MTVSSIASSTSVKYRQSYKGALTNSATSGGQNILVSNSEDGGSGNPNEQGAWGNVPSGPGTPGPTDDFSDVISKKRRRLLTAEARRIQQLQQQQNTESDSDLASVSKSQPSHLLITRGVSGVSGVATAVVNNAGNRRNTRRVGVSVVNSELLSAAKDLTRKRVYCVNNVRSNVSCTDISEFVKGLNVRILSCFATKTRFNNANAFRICINAEDIKPFTDVNNWPNGIVIRDWKFKDKTLILAGATASDQSDINLRMDTDVVNLPDRNAVDVTTENPFINLHDAPIDSSISIGPTVNSANPVSSNNKDA
jgi:hypothetical protein